MCSVLLLLFIVIILFLIYYLIMAERRRNRGDRKRRNKIKRDRNNRNSIYSSDDRDALHTYGQTISGDRICCIDTDGILYTYIIHSEESDGILDIMYGLYNGHHELLVAPGQPIPDFKNWQYKELIHTKVWKENYKRHIAYSKWNVGLQATQVFWDVCGIATQFSFYTAKELIKGCDTGYIPIFQDVLDEYVKYIQRDAKKPGMIKENRFRKDINFIINGLNVKKEKEERAERKRVARKEADLIF
eukprot:45692_1